LLYVVLLDQIGGIHPERLGDFAPRRGPGFGVVALDVRQGRYGDPHFAGQLFLRERARPPIGSFLCIGQAAHFGNSGSG
jgi:hypothetical protein